MAGHSWFRLRRSDDANLQGIHRGTLAQRRRDPTQRMGPAPQRRHEDWKMFGAQSKRRQRRHTFLPSGPENAFATACSSVKCHPNCPETRVGLRRTGSAKVPPGTIAGNASCQTLICAPGGLATGGGGSSLWWGVPAENRHHFLVRRIDDAHPLDLSDWEVSRETLKDPASPFDQITVGTDDDRVQNFGMEADNEEPH